MEAGGRCRLVRALGDYRFKGTDYVGSVAASPDGCLLATGHGDGTVRVWDARSGTEVLALPPRGDWAVVAFTPVSGLLAVVTDASLRFCHPATGGVVRRLPWSGGPPDSFVISPDERYAAAVDGWHVALADLAAGEAIGIETLQCRHVAFTPDSRSLVYPPGGDTVRLYDLACRGEGGVIDLGLAEEDGCDAIALSPDGRLLATFGGRRLGLYDAVSGRLIRKIDIPAWRACFSPDGRSIACDVENETTVFDVDMARTLFTLPGASRVAFTGDGACIAGDLHWSQCIAVWDATTGEAAVMPSGHRAAVRSVAFSPDGSHLASGSDDGTVRLWATNGGGEPVTLDAPGPWPGARLRVGAVAYSPDGRVVAASSSWDRVCLWRTEALDRPLVLPTNPLDRGGVGQIGFSPDGGTLYVGECLGRQRMVDMGSGGVARVIYVEGGHGTGPLALSSDGRLIATPLTTGGVTLWRAGTNDRTGTIPGIYGTPSAVALSSRGVLAIGSVTGSVTTWDVGSQERLAFLAETGPAVHAVAFSPGGRLAAAAFDRARRARRGGVVRIWRTDTWELADAIDLTPSGDWPCAVAFSPDGRTLAVGTARGVVLLFDASGLAGD